MGKRKFIKPEPAGVRGMCVICGRNPQKKVGGTLKFMAMCTRCNKRLYETADEKARAADLTDARKRPYRVHVQDRCARCGFAPEHLCQLDVDHIDADHDNDAPDNLQTLCANCHRLKTYCERHNMALPEVADFGLRRDRLTGSGACSADGPNYVA